MANNKHHSTPIRAATLAAVMMAVPFTISTPDETKGIGPISPAYACARSGDCCEELNSVCTVGDPTEQKDHFYRTFDGC